jgi:erythrocyte band 7 integral membrane protein
VLGTRNLSEILSEREEIGETMHRNLEVPAAFIQSNAIPQVATDPWGVHVDRVEIKDVRLPQQMQVLVSPPLAATM